MGLKTVREMRELILRSTACAVSSELAAEQLRRFSLFPLMHRPPRSTSLKAFPKSVEDRTVTVRTEPIELCQLLKFSGLADTGGQAKQSVAEGKVLLNGVVETQKRKKIRAGDRVTFGTETIVVVVA